MVKTKVYEKLMYALSLDCEMAHETELFWINTERGNFEDAMYSHFNILWIKDEFEILFEDDEVFNSYVKMITFRGYP
jgi:hypothetical protein